MGIKQDQLAKNPSNYASSAIDQKETFEFEQNPIESFNEFSDAEEAELKKKKKQKFDLLRRKNVPKKNELKNES